MTTQTDELLAFYAAEFERETGCKWTATTRGDEPALICRHRARVGQVGFVNALEGKLTEISRNATTLLADYSAEPIGIAEWHQRVVEMRL